MTYAYELRDALQRAGISPAAVVVGAGLWNSASGFNRSCTDNRRLSRNKRRLVADRLRRLSADAGRLADEVEQNETTT